MMYIKAIIKELKYNNQDDDKDKNCIVIKLEGVEKYNLQWKDYQDLIELMNTQKGSKSEEDQEKNVKITDSRNKNIFIDDNSSSEIFNLKDPEMEFNIQDDKMYNLIKDVFISGKCYIFEVDANNILGIRKCD